jgi:hypothetical protein
MAKIEKLQCPSCGAHDVSHISGINYQCNYCQSTFIIKNENSFSKINFEDINKAVPQKNSVKSVKIIITIAIFMVLVGVGLSLFIVTADRKTDSNGSAFFSDWQKPSIDNYNCLTGSKGAIVWLVLKNQTNKLDSVKYILRLIDPLTKKIISDEPLGRPKAWKELFNRSQNFDSEYYVNNDTVYNVSEDGGIQGFTLYSGKKLFGNERFEKRFPQLKTGISIVNKEYYRNRIKITSAAGDDYYYFLDSKLLLTEKEAERSNSLENTFSESIYLSQNKKSQLYLCTIKRRANEDHYISDSYIEQFKERQSYMSSYIKNIKLISDSIYPMAKPIESYKDKLLFFYASKFSKHADGVLALVDRNGQFIWKNNDSTFKKIVEDNTGDHIYLNYKLNNDLIVININKAGHQSVGVNLKTGKTQFVFNQPYSID